jgi:hypothetical protein
MIPTLIVLGLLALGVGIVAFATRRSPGAPASVQSEQDTAWNDPITPADRIAPTEDPFAHAPPVTTAPVAIAEETRS